MTHVLSFGAGVQSTALLLLWLDNDPRLIEVTGGAEIAFAVFADPGAESVATYRHLARCVEAAEAAGRRLVVARRVERGEEVSLPVQIQTARRFSMAPFFASSGGSGGMMMRNCTADYKVGTVRQAVRRELGVKALRAGRVINVLGISTDEIQRAKGGADVAYPLIEMGWSRADCLAYLRAQGWGDVPKSACVWCPYHSSRAWLDLYRARLTEDGAQDWAQVVEMDGAIRRIAREGRGGVKSILWLNAAHRPIEEYCADLDRQLDLLDLLEDEGGWGNECGGNCGL